MYKTMVKHVVYNIEYDTDGAKVELPDDTDPEDVEQLLSDEISNITGFCHFGFLIEGE